MWGHWQAVLLANILKQAAKLRVNSDDPLCSCHPASKKPTTESLWLTLYDAKQKYTLQLHGEDTELDVTFDIITGTMILKQKIRLSGIWPRVQQKTVMYANRANSIFVNLQGSSDNSILLTFKMLSPLPPPSSSSDDGDDGSENERTKQKPEKKFAEHTPRIWRQVSGFFPDLIDEGPLFEELLENCSREKLLRLHIPDARHNDWKTIALILLTYRKIDLPTWHRLVTSEKLTEIAGLNWRLVEKKTDSEAQNLRRQKAMDMKTAAQEAKMTRASFVQSHIANIGGGARWDGDKGAESLNEFTTLSHTLSPHNGFGGGDGNLAGLDIGGET
ncbi:hypothetical protein N7510_011447 [Penicillium lagena]|uniref:uncharacterized protein n=1 Tax=Penicillium lagena TaxID=94218 RepID=UPI0025409371|nr:uncharacterized protein N7510_011447 [Penicillium lagena]KAJ5601913.1 hypothetical protein N7510_011447 [Penicillium lagena]